MFKSLIAAVVGVVALSGCVAHTETTYRPVYRPYPVTVYRTYPVYRPVYRPVYTYRYYRRY